MAVSSSTPTHWYQIFINHRGVDVKQTFARSLYLRLLQKGLKPFLDQDEMQQGYNFPSQLKHAIRTASVHVAIFSPRYAESYYCLHELQLMLESESPIIPVFYRVTPAEVRWTQSKGNYAQALKELAEKKTDEGTLRYDPSTIGKWRNALSQVADNSGFELKVAHNGEELELELLDKVVDCLSKMLKRPDLHVADYPTGLDYKLKDFEDTVLLQQQQSGKPQILGIAGLGGVGKTTLAKQFFNKKNSDYHKCCFLDDVKDHAAKGSLHLLQRKLLKDLARLDKPIDNVHEGKQMLIEHFIESSKDLGRSDKSENSVDEGKEMSIKPLKSSNVLIILDDVNNVVQVEALLPLQTPDLLSGSLILITSRDKGVLKRARVKETSIYTLTGLNTQYSRELFCSYAFSQAYPLQGYKYLTDKFLESCNGLPLSLKVLGALLYGKEISEWEDELGRLPTEVKESLKISYDALDHEEQQIFLDIACFLRGQNRDTAISIWNRSGWNGRRGFKNLQDRCLVEVDSWNVMHMHEHLRDLGGDVAEKSEPFRLWRWTHKVVDGLLKQSSVITVRGLKMDSSECNEYRHWPYWHDVFGRISTTRLQILDTEDDVLEQILGTVESPHMERISRRMEIPEILWLRWRKCPYSSLPSWIQVKNLRYLDVSESELITLWESESESQVPFQLAVFLEGLITSSCVKLKSIPGLGYHTRLRQLDVSRCSELEEMPSMETLTSLEEFYAGECVKLKSIPALEHCTKLRVLSVYGCCHLEELPSMETLTSLETFYTTGCVKLKSIPALEQCSKLKVLSVYGCSDLEELPSMETLASMEVFQAFECVKLKRIRGLGQCAKLRVLGVNGCSDLEELPSMETLAFMEKIYAYGCVKLKSIPSLEQCSKLTVLSVSGCSDLEELPSMETLTSLETFDARECVKLKRIRGLGQCAKLRVLGVGGCSDLEELPSMETLASMEKFYAYGCVKLKSIPSLEQCSKLTVLSVYGCSDLEELPSMETLTSLEEFDASDCVKLKSIPALEQCSKLTLLRVDGCSDLEELPSMETLTSLERFYAHGCVKLKSIPALEHCTKLRVLSVSGCCELEEVEGVEHCTWLEKVNMSRCPKLHCPVWE